MNEFTELYYKDEISKTLNATKKGRPSALTKIVSNIKNKKKRGVYKFTKGNSTYWRVMFSLGREKLHTFGYYYSKKEAEIFYKLYYNAYYGVNPY